MNILFMNIKQPACNENLLTGTRKKNPEGEAPAGFRKTGIVRACDRAGYGCAHPQWQPLAGLVFVICVPFRLAQALSRRNGQSNRNR